MCAHDFTPKNPIPDDATVVRQTRYDPNSTELTLSQVIMNELASIAGKSTGGPTLGTHIDCSALDSVMATLFETPGAGGWVALPVGDYCIVVESTGDVTIAAPENGQS